MKKNAIVAQSGGPTVVINASLAGVADACLKAEEIDKVYGGCNGIEGILAGQIIDMGAQLGSDDLIETLKLTPSMALGSCRYKLPKFEDSPEIYEKIKEIFEKLNIGYFFYIGGNDSMDTANKLARYFADQKLDIKAIGVPKTIDDDLAVTDHTPGYGSAAKYIATSMLEIIRDVRSSNYQTVLVVEIMGRNAGFLTAAASLPYFMGVGAPQLVYCPENVFDMDKFLADIERLMKTDKQIVVAVSEGVQFADGRYVCEGAASSDEVDNFGHKQLSGTASYLANVCKEKFGCRVRNVEYGALQRCAAHCNSKVDVDEAFEVGVRGVKAALAGETCKFIAVKRISNNPYTIEYNVIDVNEVANAEKKVPDSWFNADKNQMTKDAYEYILPLIQGNIPLKEKDGMPQFLTFDQSSYVL
ncbi:MAG: 6-phosphofructokinase [Oscillospiraceae bacterium]